jgi:hypothetical protein
MKTKCYRIRYSKDSNWWLDAYDENGYQWTNNEAGSWPFLEERHVIKRLEQVQISVPTAVYFASSL